MAQAQTLSPGALPAQPEIFKEAEWHENLNVRVICKDCQDDPPELVEDHASGDLMCANCGLVLQQRVVDQSSEWRTFSNDEQGTDDPSRVGDMANSLLNGAQLNTGIAFGDGGMRSRELGRAMNKSNQDKGNKALMQAYKQIGALCDGWQLPTSVSDTAKHIYKDADESRIFRGKSQEALIAGCVFLACRRNAVPRTFREVMELTHVSKKEIGRTFKTLESFLMKQQKEREGRTAMVAGGEYFFFSFAVRFTRFVTKHERSRRTRPDRAVQRQRYGGPGRSVLALLQYARHGSEDHQRGNPACHQD